MSERETKREQVLDLAREIVRLAEDDIFGKNQRDISVAAETILKTIEPRQAAVARLRIRLDPTNPARDRVELADGTLVESVMAVKVDDNNVTREATITIRNPVVLGKPEVG